MESLQTMILYLMFFLAATVGLLIYFLPAVIAFARKYDNKIPVLLVNIFFGWTFIGWVVALIWSTSRGQEEVRKVSKCQCKDCVYYDYDAKKCTLHQVKIDKNDSCSYSKKIK